MALDMAASRVVAGDVDTVYARVLAMPLEEIFVSWHGPMPPLQGSEGPLPWETVGQQRKVIMVGPGWMTETLTEVAPPHRFSYRLGNIHGPMSPLIAGVDGRWSFRAVDAGTEITWTWRVTARTLARWVLPAFAWLWKGYADRALLNLDGRLRDVAGSTD